MQIAIITINFLLLLASFFITYNIFPEWTFLQRFFLSIISYAAFSAVQLSALLALSNKD